MNKIEMLGEELERAAKMYAARALERSALRLREGANLLSPEVAEARRLLREIAIEFASEAMKTVDNELVP